MAKAMAGMTPEPIRDPDYTPPTSKAIPLGIQQVPALFVSNVAPAIIIAVVPNLAIPEDAGQGDR